MDTYTSSSRTPYIRGSNLKQLAALHVVQVIGVDRPACHMYLIGGTPREEMTGAVYVQASSAITRQKYECQIRTH